jgi:Uncharacterized alpha/beta hydrolase domain (DUF2235)
MLPRTIEGMKHVCYFRHALALDERRVKFLPEYAYGGTTMPPPQPENMDTSNVSDKSSAKSQPPKNKDAAGDFQDRKKSARNLAHTKEVWFAGTHSDV